MSTAKQKDSQKKRELWDQFLTTWPLERIRRMKLEEYTDLHRSDALL
jgi:hypothetical protein